MNINKENITGSANEYNTEVTYSWNKTKFPTYSFSYNGKLIEKVLTDEHSEFTYYDANVGKLDLDVLPKEGLKTLKFVEGNNEEIATIKSNYCTYFQTCLNTLAQKMLFEDTAQDNGAYWLANRVISPGEYCVFFGVYLVQYKGIETGTMFRSNDPFWSYSKSVRAVVTLDKDVLLVESKTIPGTYDIVK